MPPPLTDRLRLIAPDFTAAPQLHVADMAVAAKTGYGLIINARPDGEEEQDEQPLSADLETAAHAAGLQYIHIPIDNGAVFSEMAIRAAAQITEKNTVPVLGFCMTGVRALRLWALAQALNRHHTPDELIAMAANADFNLSSFAEHLTRLYAGKPPFYVADNAALMI